MSSTLKQTKAIASKSTAPHVPSIVRNLPVDPINPISFSLATRFLAGEKLSKSDRILFGKQILVLIGLMKGMENPTLESLFARRAENEKRWTAAFDASTDKYVLQETILCGAPIDTRHNPP
jgi:hypothetical protein